MWSFWSATGGVGCTIVAVASSLYSAGSRPTLLVDLRGDVMAVLGVETGAPGVADWVRAARPPPDALGRLEVPVGDGLSVLPVGDRHELDAAGWPTARVELLARLLATDERQVIVDVGTDRGWCEPVVSAARRSILVTRLCYLAAVRAPTSRGPDGIIVQQEPGRLLTPADVGTAFSAPIETTIRWDPSVAAAVDTGALARRVPRALRSLRPMIRRR